MIVITVAGNGTQALYNIALWVSGLTFVMLVLITLSLWRIGAVYVRRLDELKAAERDARRGLRWWRR